MPESIVENEVLKTMIEEDMSQTSRDFSKRFGVSHTGILQHIHNIWKVQKIDKNVP